MLLELVSSDVRVLPLSEAVCRSDAVVCNDLSLVFPPLTETIVSVQSETAPLPACEYEFAGHAEHSLSVICLTASEYLSAPQLVHAASPTSALYLPATHSVHVTPSGPVVPATHVHKVSSPLPSPEYVFNGHSLHVESAIWAVPVENFPCRHSEHFDDPSTSLYVPAMHAVQPMLPSGPVYPLLQMQSVWMLLPSPEYVPDGQSLHVASILPFTVENFPGAHNKHA